MDLYAVLGVSSAASADEIERAYRRLARRFHPGLNPGDAQAAERYKQIEHAYRILADNEQRQLYDRGAVHAETLAETVTTVSFTGFDFSAAAEGTSAGTF